MKMKMKNGSHRCDINRPRPRHDTSILIMILTIVSR